MTTETFELFFALLTIATLAATAGLVAARIVAGMRGTGSEVLRECVNEGSCEDSDREAKARL